MASPSRSWSVASSSSSTDFERVLELGDLGLLLRGDDVERGELVVHVHAEPGPGLALVLRGHVGSASWQVTDVPDGRLDHVVLAQVLGDLLGLGGRLHDHQPAGGLAVRGGCGRVGTTTTAGLPLTRVGVGCPARRSGCHLALLHHQPTTVIATVSTEYACPLSGSHPETSRSHIHSSRGTHPVFHRAPGHAMRRPRAEPARKMRDGPRNVATPRRPAPPGPARSAPPTCSSGAPR